MFCECSDIVWCFQFFITTEYDLCGDSIKDSHLFIDYHRGTGARWTTFRGANRENKSDRMTGGGRLLFHCQMSVLVHMDVQMTINCAHGTCSRQKTSQIINYSSNVCATMSHFMGTLKLVGYVASPSVMHSYSITFSYCLPLNVPLFPFFMQPHAAKIADLTHWFIAWRFVMTPFYAPTDLKLFRICRTVCLIGNGLSNK